VSLTPPELASTDPGPPANRAAARPDTSTTTSAPRRRSPVERGAARAVGAARHLAILAVAGISLTAMATFVWAIAKSIRLVDALVGGAWRNDLSVVDLLEAIDLYLIALVQLIVIIGLYELFIGDLDVPAWLEVRTLEDLKKTIVDVLIVFIAIKGIEGLLRADTPLDALINTAAAAILLLALTAFRAIHTNPTDHHPT
jgi:uncharacterized membrane protein YqhA